ncbi:mucolipin-3-like isoform X2 [Mizuhopecten yessoensis]|uniref:mucolipin-3-like isoform X2 n=1 Tax=Mizuhopecten yessoensis TaxID=6573 RepID=UPI000B45A47A|nr:mucolipin-3-like isoform X2 [Mizuhopecten yessoensis]
MASFEMKSRSEDTQEIENNNQNQREPEVELEQSLKHALQQHFRNPFAASCSGCKVGRPSETPVKLAVLAIKLLFVIVTLAHFGNQRASFAKYIDRNNLALKRLLLLDWTNLFETMPYPPATGQYALYSIDELMAHLNHTVHKVTTLPMTSVGSLFVSSDEDHPVNICVEYYDTGIYNRTTKDIQFDQTRRKVCHDIGINDTDNYNLNPTIPELMRGEAGALVRLIHLQVEFAVDSIHVDMEKPDISPRCFHIQGKILFDNSDINGQMPVRLESDVLEMVCTLNGAVTSRSDVSAFVLCSFSILFTSLSLVFCLCSVVKSVSLCCTRKYIKTKFDTPLSLSEQLEIINARELVTMVGDAIMLTGLILYIVLNSRVMSSSSFLYDLCGVLLGSSFILICFGALHFLSFNKGFHILFDVMENSLLPVFRFLVCAAILFIAFALCGWMVMGPYHIKFTSIFSTFRCLFGLIAGDEIYVTLAAIEDEFSFPWWFCAVFVTLYITIFTIVALNILIAIFTASYDSIKNKTKRDRVKSNLIRFIDE